MVTEIGFCGSYVVLVLFDLCLFFMPWFFSSIICHDLLEGKVCFLGLSNIIHYRSHGESIFQHGLDCTGGYIWFYLLLRFKVKYSSDNHQGCGWYAPSHAMPTNEIKFWDDWHFVQPIMAIKVILFICIFLILYCLNAIFLQEIW